MGIYVFSREVMLDIIQRPGVDFGKEIIPGALGTLSVQAYLYRGYWADVGTIAAFYDANIQLTRADSPFNFFHPRFPIYTHPRFLPSTRAHRCQVDASIVAEGCELDDCQIRDSVVGIRTHVSPGAKISRSVLLGADFYQEEDPGRRGQPRHRAGRHPRGGDRRQERQNRRRRAAAEHRGDPTLRRRRLVRP